MKKTLSEFERWFSTIHQALGRVAAKAAWDHQQKIIDKLKAEIKGLKNWQI